MARIRDTWLHKALFYLTNNEATPKDEEYFDIFFWIVATLALLVGVYVLIVKQEVAWIAFLVIEYVWAWDNMRHNR